MKTTYETFIPLMQLGEAITKAENELKSELDVISCVDRQAFIVGLANRYFRLYQDAFIKNYPMYDQSEIIEKFISHLMRVVYEQC